jgi:hypothetical protein
VTTSPQRPQVIGLCRCLLATVPVERSLHVDVGLRRRQDLNTTGLALKPAKSRATPPPRSLLPSAASSSSGVSAPVSVLSSLAVRPLLLLGGRLLLRRHLKPTSRPKALFPKRLLQRLLAPASIAQAFTLAATAAAAATVPAAASVAAGAGACRLWVPRGLYLVDPDEDFFDE